MSGSAGLAQPIKALAHSAHGLDYDASSRKPVTMAFALLVPDNAVEVELRHGSRLVGIFRIHESRQQLLAAQTTEEICQCYARDENRATR